MSRDKLIHDDNPMLPEFASRVMLTAHENGYCLSCLTNHFLKGGIMTHIISASSQ